MFPIILIYLIWRGCAVLSLMNCIRWGGGGYSNGLQIDTVKEKKKNRWWVYFIGYGWSGKFSGVVITSNCWERVSSISREITHSPAAHVMFILCVLLLTMCTHGSRSCNPRKLPVTPGHFPVCSFRVWTTNHAEVLVNVCIPVTVIENRRNRTISIDASHSFIRLAETTMPIVHTNDPGKHQV